MDASSCRYRSFDNGPQLSATWWWPAPLLRCRAVRKRVIVAGSFPAFSFPPKRLLGEAADRFRPRRLIVLVGAPGVDLFEKRVFDFSLIKNQKIKGPSRPAAQVDPPRRQRGGRSGVEPPRFPRRHVKRALPGPSV